MGIDNIRAIKAAAGQPKERKQYRIPGKGVKKLAQEAAAKEAGTDGAMDKWFDDRRKEMTGCCLFCQYATEQNNDVHYRSSIAHLFAKRPNMFPSIKLHPANFIELCFFGNACHTNFDTHMIIFEDIKYQNPEAWEVIVEKTKILYPCMTEKEKNKVPEILINEIK